MLKPMLKLVRNKGGRGSKAPAFLFARPNLFVRRLGQASWGYMLAGTGVVAAAVAFVSLLSWMAPDSDRPIGSPLERIERAASGVLEQVDEQVTALLETDGETMRPSVSEGVTAAGFRILGTGESLREITAKRSVSASPAPLASAGRPSSNAAPPAQGRSFSPTTSESAPQAEREPSPPSSTSLPSSSGETPPPAAEELPLTTSEPTLPPVTETPPPATEEPSTVPPAEELPPTEEPSTPPAEEPLPTTDETAPPATKEPSPITDRPALPPTEGPPPAKNYPPPLTNQPPPPPIQ